MTRREVEVGGRISGGALTCRAMVIMTFGMSVVAFVGTK